MNKLFDNNIILLEPGHRYMLKNDPDFEFKSVTSVISEYFEPFDATAIATKLVNTHPKYIGKTINEVIDKWNAARDYGSKVHLQIESYLDNKIKPQTKEALTAIDWLKKYRLKSDFEIHSEVRVFSKELKFAGSIDILAHDKKNDVYEIIDWKTSKSIDQVSFNHKKGAHKITSHLMDCNFVHYSMQLSFYRYLLEEFYGIKVSNQLIAHVNKDECVAHVADYYKKEVQDIVEHQNNLEEKCLS